MRKVCLIGFSESTREDAPVNDKSWEFWGINSLFQYLPDVPWSAWFELHSPRYIENATHRWPDYPKWLQECSFPIYMQRHYPEIPASVAYPLKEIQKKLIDEWNCPEVDYFTSTASFALLLALHENVDEFAIYGIDMVKDSEWSFQKPNCEYLIGLMRGRGMKVHVPAKAALLKSQWLYGYEEGPANEYGQLKSKVEARILDLDGYCKTLMGEVNKTRESAQAQVNHKLGEYHEHVGALKESRIWHERLVDLERGAQ